MRSILFVAFAFTICAAQADEPFVEIAGVKITRGMPEASVRAAFAEMNCDGDTPNSCSVGDGVPPEYDGEVTFVDGRIRSAVRNLPMPEEPGEVLMLLYTTLERVANADRTCAQVQLFSTDSGLKSMAIGWPDKALWIQTHGPSENRRFDMIKETLRPADQQSEVTWNGRCVYGS
jgi:hypothetical protein